MRVVLVLILGFAGGIAGALFTRLLEDDPAPREGRRAASDAPTRQEFEQLSARTTRLERRAPAPAAPETGGAAAAPEAPTEGPGDAPAADDESGGAAAEKTPSEIVQGLLGKRFGYRDSNRLIWWLSRNKDKTSEVIAGIEKEIEKDPSNPDLHVALAAAWTAELINQPPGPQQGLAWAKVSAAYDAALALEPNHWQARFGKAFGTSMAPEFVGMRPEAIRQFEELKAIQSRQAPEPEHAQVYFRLGTLYKDAGNAEKARAIWAEGLKLFPDNQELRDTLEASTKK